MPSPFSIYASAFLNRSTIDPTDTSAASSQPLFYSVTEGSHINDSGSDYGGARTPGSRSEVDDEGDPRLAGSYGRGGEPVMSDSHHARVRDVLFDSRVHDHDDDPYLDEGELDVETQPVRRHEEHVDPNDPYDPELADFDNDMDALPLIGSSMMGGSRYASPPPKTYSQGWRNHQSVIQAPMSPPLSTPSRSPSPSESSMSSPPQSYLLSPPPVPPTRTAMSVQLQESLLPRDGVSRSLFYLPDPDRALAPSKYHDSAWMSAWLGAVSVCILSSVLILFFTNPSPKPPTSSPTTPIPYSTLTHTIPLLTLLTIGSASLSYGYLLLFRFAVRPMLILTALSTPLFLFVASAYAFAGSFFYERGVNTTWGETVGLRLFSLVPLACAYLSAKSFYQRYESLLQTVSVVELSTSLLTSHPSVLLLSLGILFASLIGSLPFLSLALRLLLIGYFSPSSPSKSDWVWHVSNYAGWLVTMVIAVWLWSWGVSRGTMRVIVSGVIGNWYFTGNDPRTTPMTQHQATRAALVRATGPSLGSICVASLTLAIVHGTLIALRALRRLTTPPQLQPFAPLHPLAFLATPISMLDSLSSYALVYIGITGEPFMVSARKAREFMSNAGPSRDQDGEDEATSRRRRRGRGRRIADYTLLSRLLTFSSLSLSVLSAIAGYIFAAHSLSGPGNAPLAAMLSGGVTFLTVRFGLGLAEDAADALYTCYNLDVSAGVKHRDEVFEAFEGRGLQLPPTV